MYVFIFPADFASVYSTGQPVSREWAKKKIVENEDYKS